MQLTRLDVAGYRSIRDLSLELGPVNVVVGANGSGKTNLYRALMLLHAAATGVLARTIVDEGGMPSLTWAGPRKQNERVRTSARVVLEELDYELILGLVPPGHSRFKLDPQVKQEQIRFRHGKTRSVILDRDGPAATLRDDGGDRVVFPGTIWGGESILSQIVEPQRFPVAAAVRHELASWRFYHHFRTDPEAPARQRRVGTYTPVLAGDGGDLAAALATIDWVGDAVGLKDAIARAFPGATLVVDVDDDTSVARYALAYPGLLRPLGPAEISDGTLRYLCLVAALMSPRPPPFLAINEPETSLHPELLAPLGDLVVEASKRTQILVTTHADALARRIADAPGAASFRLHKSEGATTLA